MKHKDKLSKHYDEILEDTYDCSDRIVLNGHFLMGCNAGGFRIWYRALKGSDEGLNNNTLMRMTGKLSRRVHAFCKSKNIPLIYSKPGERKHEVAETLIPKDENFTGIFAVFVGRAQGPVWDVKEYGEGKIFLRKKQPRPFINHYYFNIIDQEWGHIIIRMSGHVPFSTQIILNGHEWVERHKNSRKISFIKEGNCFTQFSSGEALSKIADTLSIKKGLLESVCNRWIYSCLWFALTKEEQERSGFTYSYSIYQVEYSRNLLFRRGTQLDEMYENLITLTRPLFDIKQLVTIVGLLKRPRYCRSKRPEIRIEKPEYGLTVFKIHFGNLTLKLYDKGERILRAEIVVHNAKGLKCKRRVDNFQEIINMLNTIMNNFMDNLHYSHVSFLNDGSLERLCCPSQKGRKRLAGIDINKKRNVIAMQSVLALAIKPGGYKISDVVSEMKLRMSKSYSTRNAGYELRKLRGKGLVEKIDGTTKYRTTRKGIETIIAIMALTQKTIPAVLSSLNKEELSERPEQISVIDQNLINVWNGIKTIVHQYGIAA
jgi:hypothetical protein